MSMPAPPYSSGTETPARPISPAWSKNERGNSPDSSISFARGLAISSANRRTFSRSSFCSSLSSIFMMPRIVPTGFRKGQGKSRRGARAPRRLARRLGGIFPVGRLVLHVAVLQVDLDLAELRLLGQTPGLLDGLFLGVVLRPVGSVLLGDDPLLGRRVRNYMVNNASVGFTCCRHAFTSTA